jgi:hypothetical protein
LPPRSSLLQHRSCREKQEAALGLCAFDFDAYSFTAPVSEET